VRSAASRAELTPTVRRSDRTIHCGHISKHSSADPRVPRSPAQAKWTGCGCEARTTPSEHGRAGQRPDAVLFGLPPPVRARLSLPPRHRLRIIQRSLPSDGPEPAARSPPPTRRTHRLRLDHEPEAGRDASRSARPPHHRRTLRIAATGNAHSRLHNRVNPGLRRASSATADPGQPLLPRRARPPRRLSSNSPTPAWPCVGSPAPMNLICAPGGRRLHWLLTVRIGGSVRHYPLGFAWWADPVQPQASAC
jgi:hypothetical protein